MTPISALKNGFSIVNKYFKVVPIVYVINLSIALFLAIPMFFAFKNLGDLGIREDMISGFSYEWWSNIKFNTEGLLETIRPTISNGFGPLFDNLQLLLTGHFNTFGIIILTSGILYLIVAAFFNGGIVAFLVDEKKNYTIGRFFSNSAFYFHHFFALAFTSVLAFFLIYKFINPAIFNLVDGITTTWINQSNVWFVNLLGYLILFLIIIIVNMIFDYAKIILVLEKKNSSWLCIGLAAKFVAGHFISTTGLYLMIAGLTVLIIMGLGAIIHVAHPSNFVLLVIAFSLQQTLILAKIYMRVVFYGAQFQYYFNNKQKIRKLKKV